jgi:outer membrane protein OmpA-like peptidoglycan-associated protein
MKKYSIIVLGLITTIIIHAQEKRSYLNLNMGSGIHSLKYDLQNGTVKSGVGAIFNVGYSYFLTPNWGLGTGLGVHSVQSKGTLSYTSGEAAIDEDGDNYEFRTYFNNWQEKQTALFLDIPLGVQHQYWFNEKNGLLAFAGAKVSIPVSSSYKVTSGSITTTGYYEQWNVELMDMPQHGFNTINDRFSGDVDLKTAYSLFVDLGWLRKISEKVDLYAGGYVNYGINNLIDSKNNLVYQSDGTYNSILASANTNKVHSMTFGIKVGIRLRANNSKKAPEAYTLPEILPVVEPAPVVKEDSIHQPIGQTEMKPQEQLPIIETIPEPTVSINDTIIKLQAIAKQIDLKFQFGSDVPLNDEFDNKFKELAQILIANPTIKVRIKGHTCNMADRDYNLLVGTKRAEVVKAKFLKMDVPECQIVTESKAFDEPLVPNTNKKNRAINRRIELVIE